MDALSEMPSYIKFLKDILPRNRKIEESCTISLTAECSAILQNHLPKKLANPGSYSIPVKLGDVEIKRALCDLGASVSLMSLSIYKKLHMGELKPTHVPIKVENFYIPCDFIVMEMEEDANISIILGRPFLAVAGATIDMKSGRICFEVGEEKIEFKLQNILWYSFMDETINRVDALE
ncbi:uncharacterized protein LOC141700667 [Apium graveolens]|uniref:uncharacterized protein LOC141700667 n=1 Tax=Apium graveolens TaxID=4045 RepID=UPI003D79D546